MSNLVNLTVQAPGWLGLNKQESGSVLPPGWATVAKNLVIDEVGRLAKRKGTRRQHASAVPSSATIEQAFTYIDTSGNTLTLIAADNKIYKLVSGTLTDISGTITTPTGNDWKFQNFNGKCIGWQEGHTPIVLATTGGTFADITASSGTLPNGRDVLAAYGRVWVIDNDTLYYSDILDETAWGAGTAGSTLLTRTWPQGVDTPVALAEFNGHLVIFGERSTVIYAGPDDPASAFSNFVKIEGIDGTGCVARDSIANIGNDLVWLSRKGLMSLGRVIQEKSMPELDLAPHMRDELIAKTQGSTTSRIKAAYSQELGLYVIVFNSATYAVDMRLRMEGGRLRVTEWDSGFRCPMVDTSGDMYFGKDDYLVKYTGELDNILSDGTLGDNITVDFEGVWNGFGDEIEMLLKFLKMVKIYVYGGMGQTIKFKWSTDYRSGFNSVQIDVPTDGTIARWGIAKYSVDSYSGSFSFSEMTSQTSRSGRVVKIGFQASLGDVPFAVHRVDLFAKLGKLAL